MQIKLKPTDKSERLLIMFSFFSENFYPTVVGESVYGNFGQALYHLHRFCILYLYLTLHLYLY